MSSTNAFHAARDFLLAHRSDYDTAYQDFAWPRLDHFNWALDHFDVIARDIVAPALWNVAEEVENGGCPSPNWPVILI